MSYNNVDPEARSGTETLEPSDQHPEGTHPVQGTMVTSESLVPRVAIQPATERPVYPTSPPTPVTQPVYRAQEPESSQPRPETQTQWQYQQVPQQPQPQPQPAYPERRGANPLLVTLLVIIGAIVVLGVVLVIAGIVFFSNIADRVNNPPIGELRTESPAIALGDARSVVVDVSMGVGTLTLSGGATDLMNATFTYNIDSWKPIVSYNVDTSTGAGTLLVQQPKSNNINLSGDARYEWNLRFKNDVPMTMKVDTGVGQSNLKFSGLNLTRLEVNNGVGENTIDLSGQWKQDLNVVVNGGVGKVTIIVPTGTGARVTAEGGLGGVNAGSLNASGSTYTNDNYGKTPTSINVDVKTGIGDIVLVQK